MFLRKKIIDFQDAAIGKLFDTDSSKLIVFLTNSKEEVNGGIMSVFSLCCESRKFTDIHGSEVMLATYPGYRTYFTNHKFPNNETVFRFDQIMINFPKLDSLLIHIPEYICDSFVSSLSKSEVEFLKNISDLKLNVMNQNLLLMPSPESLLPLYSLTSNITQTTAQRVSFSNSECQKYCDKYGIPMHRFGVFLDPDDYRRRNYPEKENIIVLSPDYCREMDSTLGRETVRMIRNRLSNELPQFEQVVVKDMLYNDYKDLVSRSKYLITFGEGLDMYFIESIASGSVSFAVYSDLYFPDERYLDLENVFLTYEDMYDSIVAMIKLLEADQNKYESFSNAAFDLIFCDYGYKKYVSNIRRYYEKRYDYLPKKPF